MVEENKSFKERIKDSINYQKVVTIRMPIKLFERFDSLSSYESNSCYWLMIEKLMDSFDDVNEDKSLVMLYKQLERRLVNVEIAVDELVSKPVEKPKEPDKKRTFG